MTPQGICTSYHGNNLERDPPLDYSFFIFVHFLKCQRMATFDHSWFGCMGFLSFCILLTFGLAKVELEGMDAIAWFLCIHLTPTLDRLPEIPEGGIEVLWPLYGTGPPAKGP